jgi:outer membrane lipoprotein-sorting protein
MKSYLFCFLTLFATVAIAQENNPANDPEAAALMKKVSEKYQSYKNISASFTLLIQHPKTNPNEDERKYIDTVKGQVLLEKEKFKVSVKDQQIFCDGKTIWTYTPSDKEVQVNDYQETDDVFSPSKIFTLYKEGYMYMIREKKTENGKKVTVIEMAPPNKKVTYFKIDITIDNAALQIVESKVFEKNGVRYIYRMTKQTTNVSTNAETFSFDPKMHPGVKVIDLR